MPIITNKLKQAFEHILPQKLKIYNFKSTEIQNQSVEI